MNLPNEKNHNKKVVTDLDSLHAYKFNQESALPINNVKNGRIGWSDDSNLSEILDSIPALVAHFDNDLRYKYANKAYQNFIGCSKESLAVRKLPEVLGAGFKSVESSVKKALAGERVDFHSVLPMNGKTNYMNVSYIPQYFDNGELDGFAALIIDNTVQKLQCDELIQSKEEADIANQAKSTFLSRMSHEFRTPLNAVLGFSQLQMKDFNDGTPKRTRTSIENIYQAGNHLLKLVSDVLDISNIETNHFVMSIESYDVQAVLNECIGYVSIQARDAKVTITKEGFGAENQAFYALVDPARLRQIVINLLTNAIKYNKTDGSICISLKNTPDSIIVEVKDTGIGFTTASINKIFEPFERLSYAVNNEIQGTGIGLSITKYLVEAMNGSIMVDSEPSVGSTFTITFERAEKSISGNNRKKRIPKTPSPTKILYIEDHKPSIAVMEMHFQTQDNINFLSATTAEGGIKTALSEIPDIIFFDINLPNINGVTAMQRLRDNKYLKNVHMVALSGNALPEHINSYMKSGFDACITKPIDFLQIDNMISEQSKKMPHNAER